MALICIESEDEPSWGRADAFSMQLKVPHYPTGHAKLAALSAKGAPGVKLLVRCGNLALGFMDKSRGKPYFVDFLSAAWISKFNHPPGAGHIFRRALCGKDNNPSVVDATAGFGQDAMLALALGCTVTAVERSPVVAALLQDGIERAEREDESVRAKLSGLTVAQADAVEYLRSLTPASAPDVVYIDPMFDKPKKTAKSPKEMQLLQELLDAPKASDTLALLNAALAAARKRVVVKMPLKGKALKASPSHSYKGQSIRYDIYTKP